MGDWQHYLIKVQQFLGNYLPLKNPVLILSVLLLIILFSPLLSKRFRIPGIIGLIISGILIGPHSFHIIESTTSFELLSKTGLLYIMFLAGLEIDMQEFRQNRGKSLVFGALTFLIPIVIGYYVCKQVFHFSQWSSVLLASMFSTHTLLSYPIVSNLGIVKNRAVQATFGGTIITDSAVLILLGVITNVVTGDTDGTFAIRIIISISLLIFTTLYLLPRFSRWFFRNVEGQASSHYIFVLSMVFISGYLSERAGVEPIIGAFLAGLGLNRLIPHTGILMNRIIFIGNTLFIPFFLISAGMLVDPMLLFAGTDALTFAGILCLVGIFTKYVAAHITGFLYRFSLPERNIMFGLSVSHAAATLAIIKVGFDIGLFNQNVVNGTIILILISCLVSSFVTERAARKIAVEEKEVTKRMSDKNERILIPVSNPENIQRLIDLSLLLKDPASAEPIYPLSIVEDSAEADEKINVVRKVIEGVVEQISSGDKRVEVLKKVDLSIVDGIVRTAKAYNITDILISYKAQQSGNTVIFGNIAGNLLRKSKQAVIISKILQPLNTFRRVLVILPPNAEFESGFVRASAKINLLLKQIGNNASVYGTHSTLRNFAMAIGDRKQVFFRYSEVNSFENFGPLSDTKGDDLYIFMNARMQTISYDYYVDDMTKTLNRNYSFTSFIIFYPDISKALQDGSISDMTSASIEKQYARVKQLTERLAGVFRREGQQPPGKD